MPPKSGKQVVAEVVSFITNPVIVTVLALALICWHYAGSVEQFWHWYLIAALLLIVPSLLFSAYVWSKERRVDIDLTNRTDRVVPLLLSTLGAIIGSFLVTIHLNNHRLLLLSYVLVGLLVILTLVTTFWKISLHATTTASAVTLLVFFGGVMFGWFYLLLVPIMWARRTLQQHTWAQLVGGTIVGVGVTTAAVWLFRG